LAYFLLAQILFGIATKLELRFVGQKRNSWHCWLFRALQYACVYVL